MMQPKYQIFISSTYTDLVKEREAVTRAILEMGHIPVGMEMFSAADETQWQIIKRQIDVSDYYVVILAHRYGSMDGAVSYTEKEYDYCIATGVPVLGFVINDDAAWPSNQVDKDPIAVEGLKSFKSKVKKKPVSFWSTADDLNARVLASLVKAFHVTPRRGWLPADQVLDAKVTEEITRLSQENARLRAEIEKATGTVGEARELDQVRTLLNANSVHLSLYYSDDTEWSRAEVPISLGKVFSFIAPSLNPECDTERLAMLIAIHAPRNEDRKLRSSWPIPSNSLNSILLDLQSLRLVEPSKKKHSVSDKKAYWTLSEFGVRYQAKLRRDQLSAGAASSSVDADDDQNEVV